MPCFKMPCFKMAARSDDGKLNFEFLNRMIEVRGQNSTFEFFNFYSKLISKKLIFFGIILTRYAKDQRITMVIWIQKIMKM